MECPKCHKSNIEPLELYTGDIACPKCKSRLNLIPRRMDAKDPRACEMLSLSELYFHYAICRNAKISATDLLSACTLTPDEMIEKSIEYCQQALKLGHPEAVYRMAFFYDKKYIKNVGTESIRLRTAAQMYLGIVAYPDAHFEGYEDNEAENRTLLLKRRAADDLYALLKEMPKRDRQLYAAKLIEYGFLTIEAATELALQAEKSDAEALLNVLEKATSRRRAPLFGTIRIRKDQLTRLTEQILSYSAIGNQKIDLMFIPLNKDDVYDFQNSIGGRSPFHVFRFTKDEIRQGISMAVEKSAENCCVYFFNKAGKHKFYSSSSKKQRLQNLISTDFIDQLISFTPGGSYVFFDDDVYFKNERIDKIIAEISAKTEV
jgi:hypothetical protein